MELSKNLDRVYTYEDYLSWNEDERWEIIDGIPYMQAAPTPKHQRLLGNLFTDINIFLRGKPCEAFPSPFTVVLSNEKSNNKKINVYEPDISIICDPSKIDDKGCNGSPDMIIEILSPSTTKNDRVKKFNVYEKFGVKEYWIVDPLYETIEVFVLDSQGRYGRPQLYLKEDTITLNIFPELKIELKIIFA